MYNIDISIDSMYIAVVQDFMCTRLSFKNKKLQNYETLGMT